MDIKDQVCSVELAQKLKELGVPQNSYFYWDQSTRFDGGYDLHIGPMNDSSCSAFTVAEIGYIFSKYKFEGKTMRCMFCPDSLDTDGINRVYLDDDKDVDSYWIEWDKNESNARAKMLIYLIENNLINLSNS